MSKVYLYTESELPQHKPRPGEAINTNRGLVRLKTLKRFFIEYTG